LSKTVGRGWAVAQRDAIRSIYFGSVYRKSASSRGRDSIRGEPHWAHLRMFLCGKDRLRKDLLTPMGRRVGPQVSRVYTHGESCEELQSSVIGVIHCGHPLRCP